MPDDAFATEDDYTARYGPTDEVTLGQKLASASNAVRAYTHRQSFADGTITQVLRLVGGTVRLPQRPVTSVTSVAFVNGNGTRTALVGFLFDGIDRVTVPDQSFVLNLPEVSYDPAYIRSVEVTWEYGYDDTPGDIVDVVCAAARRAMTNPDQLSTELVGAYQNAVASDAASAGPIGFSDAERDILNNYRVGAVTTVQT